MSDERKVPNERERLQDLFSKIAEQFPDALVLVRGKEGLISRATESTWAAGAALRYYRGLLHEDQIAIEDAMLPEE